MSESTAAGRTTSPNVIVFDVNETLSDMSPLTRRFEAVGAPPELAATWFASLLRDGFALSTVGSARPFAELARQTLVVALHGVTSGPLDAAVDQVLAGLPELEVHPDVVGAIAALVDQGRTLVTLSNGAASVADGLLTRAGIRDRFAALLSVEDAGIWKPAAAAYAHALRACNVPAAEAMLVAVHPWDIDGAHRAGLATAWINRSGGPYPDHFARADVEASSLVELAERLAAPRSEGQK